MFKKGKTMSKFTLTPQSFDEFIGQKAIVTQIKEEISTAKQNGASRIPSILLLGKVGSGKTALASVIADELGAKIAWIDATTEGAEKVLSAISAIAKENNGVVIVADEIDNYPASVQELVLSAAAKGDNITLIATASKPERVIDSVKGACTAYTLEDYSSEELVAMAKIKASAAKLALSDEIINKCVSKCDGCPRVLDAILTDLSAFCLINEIDVVSDSDLNDLFRVKYGE